MRPLGKRRIHRYDLRVRLLLMRRSNPVGLPTGHAKEIYRPFVCIGIVSPAWRAS